MIVATSATVRNLTSLSEVASAAIDSPLPACCVRLARFSAPVTPVSSVSPVRKRATPARGINSVSSGAGQFHYGAAANPGSGKTVAPSAAAQLAPTIPRGLDGRQERGPDPVLLQLANRVDRRAAGGRHRLAQDHRMLARGAEHGRRAEHGLLD